MFRCEKAESKRSKKHSKPPRSSQQHREMLSKYVILNQYKISNEQLPASNNKFHTLSNRICHLNIKSFLLLRLRFLSMYVCFLFFTCCYLLLAIIHIAYMMLLSMSNIFLYSILCCLKLKSGSKHFPC